MNSLDLDPLLKRRMLMNEKSTNLSNEIITISIFEKKHSFSMAFYYLF